MPTKGLAKNWRPLLTVCLIMGLVVGCTRHTALTNEEVVAQTKYCEDNGLKARALYVWGEGLIFKIQCDPDKKNN